METNNKYHIFYMMAAIASLVLVGLATPAKSQEANVVDDVCLACICDASSGCNVTRACNGDVCGLFGITWFYWADSGKLTVNGESEDSPMVQNYMRKFRQDCNQDGKIDCLDFASIHRLGGYGCPGRIFGSYATTLNQCLAAYATDGNENSEETPEAMPSPDITPDTPQVIQNSDMTPDNSQMLSNSAITPDTSQTMPNSDITPNAMVSETAPSSTNVTEQPQIANEIAQVPSIEDFVQNFDFSTERSNETAEGSGDNSVGDTTDLPPLTLLELLRPQNNTTTPSSIESELDKIFDNIPEMMVESQGAVISPKNDIGTDLSTIESSQDRFYEILERMEKSKNEHTDRELSVQEKFLEAFLNKNRIEEEKNQILKEIAENNNLPGTDVQQLQRRAIENSQSRFFDRLERIEKSENEHREKQLSVQEQFLEAFINKNRIEEERNKVLKEIAQIDKPKAKTASNYFLL